MTIGTGCYQLLVYPLEFFIETVFSLVYELIGSLGYSILAVSVVVSVLVLPMYARSDKIQEEERRQQEKLAYWAAHIRRGFRGEERTMLLSEYYRQMGYRPLYALRGSISLLLQIPFFMAAYHFLSNLWLLRGASFYMIRDLGAPDALLSIGGLTLHVLPVLMTAINIVSGAIYTRGFPLSQKLQLYGMALVFLVLLYGSPSGLVLYWTMNNVFSLCKNIVMKLLSRPGRGTAGGREGAARGEGAAFLLVSGALAAFLGLMIPLAPIAASPGEFVTQGLDENPLALVATTGLTWAGLLLVWNGVAYYLMKREARAGWSRFLFALLPICMANYFTVIAGTHHLSQTMAIYSFGDVTERQMWRNVAVFLAAAVLGGILARRLRAGTRALAAGVILTAVLAFCAVQGAEARRELRSLAETSAALRAGAEPRISMSREGKNVVVLMLDRGVGKLIPYLFAERPELAERFSGFTFYPNALSYGNHTNYAMPAIFGGYEYTPAAINARPELSLRDKHDEALTLMPRLLGEAGYRVSVFDPSYAGYQETPDLTIYDGLPGVGAYRIKGRYVGAYADYFESFRRLQIHHLVGYSIYRAVPVVARGWVYDRGAYRGVSRFGEGPTGWFYLQSYSSLEKLPELTELCATQPGDGAASLPGCVTLMVNDLTHDPDDVALPDYVPGLAFDNRQALEALEIVREGKLVREGHPDDYSLLIYEAHMAAFLKLADWFDRLRALGVYDNTRIILVSDHGYDNLLFEDDVLDNGINAQSFNPLLLVKDFGAAGALRTDRSFMTNADVPSLAMEGLIDAPVNPYTGHPVDQEEKVGPQRVTSAHLYDIADNHGNVFQSYDSEWHTVERDIFDPACWDRGRAVPSGEAPAKEEGAP